MQLRCTIVLPPGHESMDLAGCSLELVAEDTLLADAAAPVVAVVRPPMDGPDGLDRDGGRLGPVRFAVPDPPAGRSWNLRAFVRAGDRLRYLTTVPVPVTALTAVTAPVLIDVPLTPAG